MNPLAALRNLADEMRECDRTAGPCYAKDWASTLDSALRLLGEGEAVAWRVFDSPHWNAGKPDQQTIDYWKPYGVPIQYAYASPVPPAVVPEAKPFNTGRDELYNLGWNACLAEFKRLNPERTNG